MFFISYIIVFAILIISWYQIKYRRRNALLAQIPHPQKYPVIHNTLSFINKSQVELFNWLEVLHKDLGNVFHFTMDPFDNSTIFMCDPKAVESLLSSQKNLDKTEDYDMMVRWLGTGLLIATGKKWHQRRKIITPTFHFKILEQFTNIMSLQGKVFVKNLTKYNGKQVDIFPLINLYTLDVICESAMGCAINAQMKTGSAYVKAVKDLSQIIVKRSADPIKRFEFLYKMSEMYQSELETLKILHGFTNDVIKSRREQLTNADEKSIDLENDEIGSKKKLALLDLLLQSTVDGKPLSDSDIREEVDTFMFEGHDTTTSGISFALYNLAKHPEIQQRVYEETKLVFDNDDAKILTVQDISSLRYLELVIKESLRMYPSVPFYGRKLSEDIVAGGYTFPKNSNVIVGAYLMGRDPEIYPEPLLFKPERFEDVETTYEKKNPFAYVPFSAGPRNCIGQKFAMLEMKSIIANIINKFELILPKEHAKLILVNELVLRPQNGIVLQIKERI